MSNDDSPTLFCFGLGYCASRLARALRAEGWRIIGTSRDAEGVHRLRAEGFEAYRFARETPFDDLAAILGQATHILSSVPPDAEGDPVLDLCGDVLRIRARPHGHGPTGQRLAELRWVGYLSTTAVYGDRAGMSVDETSPLAPSGERGRRRAEAEAGWRRVHTECGLPLHIFRLAGIYGPGRSAIDQLRAGTARRIRKEGHVFSRIHVDDVVGVLRASMAAPQPGALYNVCDDEPASAEAVVAYAAELMGIAPPPLIEFESARLSPMARSFYADNKRVSNRRLKERLGVRLCYPSYREGLRALLGV